MKFAPMNYHYLRYPIKKFLDKVERSPFNSIDLYCSAPQLNLFDYPLLRLIELKKEIEAHHLSVMAMTPENCVYPVNFCTQDDLTRESSIRYYQRAIDTAQFLDCPCVQISTGFGYFDQPREEGWKYCRESLWTLAQYCEKKDVRLLLEELKVTTTNVLITSKDIAKMLEEIESPSIVGMVDAKKIWSYARRLLAIIPSIFICALGVALLVWPEWGCDPLTTFEIGLSNVFHVQFGTVALVFEGIMFFVFFFVRRDLVHLGTLAWCFLIGPFENFWLDVLAPMLPTAPEMSVGLKIACILIGSIIIILTLAYYIPIGLGYQTSDIFAFMAADLVKKSYGIGLIISYAILFVIGVALGSSWGIGTLIAVVAYGPIIDRLMGIIEPFSFAVAGMKKENKKGK